MLLWGVEARELDSLQLACRFPGYDCWTKVSWHHPDLLLTNAMTIIESSCHVPQLPPRPSTLVTPGTPAASSTVDHRLSVPDQPATPPCKTPRATASNGRRHRKKEFQMQPTRARCEVRTITCCL